LIENNELDNELPHKNSYNKAKSIFLIILLILLCFSHPGLNVIASNAHQIETSTIIMKINGTLHYKGGNPVEGAEIRLGLPASRGLNTVNYTTSNSQGQYFIETPIVYTHYYLLIEHDQNETLGLDWIPVYYKFHRRYPTHNLTTILEPAATIIFNGPYQSIKSYNPKMEFTIYDENIEPIQVHDNGLQFGYTHDYTQLLNYNASTIIVPANRNYVLSSSIFNISSKDETSLVLQQGQVLHLQIQKYTLRSEIELFRQYNRIVLDKINDYQDNGFFSEYEYNQHNIADNQFSTSIEYYQNENYGNAFFELKSAYIRLQNVDTLINQNISEAKTSIAPSLIFLAITSLSISSLFVENKAKRTIYSVLLTVIMYATFYAVFPGRAQLSYQIMLVYGGGSILSAYLIVNFLKYVLRSGRRGGISLYDALSASIILAVSNLRRRMLRSILVFLTVLVISMSFISLTSISVTYGLVQQEQMFVSSTADGVIMRMHEYVSPYKRNDVMYGSDVGYFNPVDDRTLEWVLVNTGISGISRKAEVQPGRETFLIGLNPETDPLMNSLDEITVIGDVLQLKGTCLIHEGRIGILEKGEQIRFGRFPDYTYLDVYDIGDLISGLEIVGGFSEDIASFYDVDGLTILPKKQAMGSTGVEAVPINPYELIITTVDDALALGGQVSRVSLLIEEDSTSVVQTLALSSNFRFWSSIKGGVIYVGMGDQFESKGESLFVLYGIVILTVVTMIYSSLYERRNEINILSSIGLNPGHISAIFLSESTILGFSGGSIGFLLGLAMYNIMSYLSFSPAVRQKISTVWIFATLGLSISSVVIGTLLALRYSIILTPSLRRKWNIDDEIRPNELDQWYIDLPTKVSVERIEEFLAFLVMKFDSIVMTPEKRKTSVIKGLSYYKIKKKTDDIIEIRFFYNIESLFERGNTRNDLIITRGDDMYELGLLVIGVQQGADIIGRLIRGFLMEWSIELGKKE